MSDSSVRARLLQAVIGCIAACVCRYQHYLESVLEVADEYQEVPDLLMRFATLQVRKVKIW